jgi:hypothetical protein
LSFLSEYIFARRVKTCKCELYYRVKAVHTQQELIKKSLNGRCIFDVTSLARYCRQIITRMVLLWWEYEDLISINLGKNLPAWFITLENIFKLFKLPRLANHLK